MRLRWQSRSVMEAVGGRRRKDLWHDSELSENLFGRLVAEVESYWKRLQPDSMESMALLLNVSLPPGMKTQYYERANQLARELDLFLGSRISRFLRDEMMPLLEALNKNMKWSGFAKSFSPHFAENIGFHYRIFYSPDLKTSHAEVCR